MRHSSRDSQIAAFRLARHHLTDSSRSATARLAFSPIAKRGTVVVPARLRRKFGIEEGQLVIAEERPDGILIRPALALPFEIYTPERKAEFLLSNAVDAEDYGAAVARG